MIYSPGKAFLVMLLLVAPASAAVVVDSELAAGAATADGALSSSFTFTNKNGNFLVCGVVLGGNDALPTITYVKYKQDPLTLIANRGCKQNANSRVALYYMLNPSTGSNTFNAISVGNTGAIIASCISFRGVDFSSPIGKVVVADDNLTSGAAAVVGLGGMVTGNMVVSVAGGGSDFGSTGNILSARTNVSALFFVDNMQMSRTTVFGSTKTMTETMIASDSWAIAAVELRQAFPPLPVIPFGGN